jgi:hypothetical protein
VHPHRAVGIDPEYFDIEIDVHAFDMLRERELLTGLEHRVIGSMRELLADVVDCAAEQSVVAAQTREPVVDELGIGSHCAFELLSLAADENFIDR